MADLSPSTELAPSRRLFGWKFRCGVVLFSAIVLTGIAPSLVARTSLRDWILARATRDLRGTVHIGSLSLGWFSRPEFHDVELRDEQNRVILTSPQVTVGRTLLGLALDHSDLGVVTVLKPSIDLVAVGDDTNLEKALAVFLEGEPTSPTRTAIDIEIHDGKLLLHDEDVRGKWNAADLEGTVTIPADRSSPVKLALRGVIEVDHRPTNAELAMEYRTGKGGPGLAPQFTLSATAESLPAAPVATFLRRFEPGLRFGGLIAGRLKIVWDDSNADQSVMHIEGHVTGRGVSLADPRLSAERVDLATLDFPCKLTWAGNRISSENSRIKCDLGEASFSGAVDLSRGAFSILETAGVSASCNIDLARLSRLLAKPMRLQPGTHVTSGRIAGEVNSRSDSGAVSWNGKLLVFDLRGVHNGQAITWDNPISAQFAAKQSPGALPRIDLCRVVSEFGNLDASGNEEQFTINGDLDLSLLARKLGQFVQLGDLNPAGNARGHLTVKRDRPETFAASGEIGLRDFAVAFAGGSFREPNLTLKFDAAGKTKGPSYRMEQAAVKLMAGQDRLEIDLLEPVSDLATFRDGHVRAGLRGDLARWRGWVTPLVTLPNDWQIAGAADATARVRFGTSGVEVDAAAANVANFRFAGAGLNIVEPRVALKPGSVKWDRKTHRLEVQEAEVTSSAVAIRLATVTVSLTDAGMMAMAKGRITGDAARVQQWLPSLTEERISGVIDGPFDIRAEGGRIHGGAELTVRTLVVGDPANPTWTEPLVRVSGRGRFEPDTDLAVLDEFKVDSNAVGVTATGRLAHLGSIRDLMLTGQLAYDLERWEPQVRRLLGKDARIVGRDRKPFRLEGSLSGNQPGKLAAGTSAAPAGPLARLKGEAAFSWQELRAFGVDVGPATVQARMLGDAWVRIQPIDTTFNQGKLKLEPFIRLEPAPIILAFGKATAVERAKLTPDLSAGSLGYVAPFFAGIRDPQGEVSIVIDGGQIPLADPDKADVWGKFIVHSARATPGPLLVQLGLLLKSPANLNLPRELVVPFRAVNGRVYHQNLEIPMGELLLKTSGSVGFDGTLSLMAEVPLPVRWFKNPPKTPPVVKLPIGGTLSNPRIDERGLQQALAERVTDAAGDAIKRELEKGLQKWFQPPKKQ